MRGYKGGHRSSADETLAILALSSAQVALSSIIAAGVIWRPGVPSNGINVFETWPEVQAKIDRVQGALIVFVDASVAPAIVPPGSWNFYGEGRLWSFDSGNGAQMTISDGATLHDVEQIQGLTVICECKTAPALAFNPFSAFLLDNFGSLILDTGALVPAITITAADGNWAMFSRLGSLDNTLAPTVPVVQIAAGALGTFYAHTAAFNFPFLTTGNEIGSAPGASIAWNNDNTVPALDSTLTAVGTVANIPSSQTANDNPSTGATAARPVAPFVLLGSMFFDTSLGAHGKPVWYVSPGLWVDATGTPA